ncbi:uncharacterized protein EV422DRAFT_512698 [Fimicolochytrium jonesii]|uniref:uncharacterized protein n=1 Tax=Fimicolochytrium jonesii TaxID=1396493 RepID=UPI0022FDF5E8|nr:uncharacterized protein EV422DRAFT_512698 [Fimicolochytrium jonesii]KAI8827117.1 hypothetical protein EV422DRAFT_512698 [Fimicolochytrium jonesii]
MSETAEILFTPSWDRGSYTGLLMEIAERTNTRILTGSISYSIHGETEAVTIAQNEICAMLEAGGVHSKDFGLPQEFTERLLIDQKTRHDFNRKLECLSDEYGVTSKLDSKCRTVHVSAPTAVDIGPVIRGISVMQIPDRNGEPVPVKAIPTSELHFDVGVMRRAKVLYLTAGRPNFSMADSFKEKAEDAAKAHGVTITFSQDKTQAILKGDADKATAAAAKIQEKYTRFLLYIDSHSRTWRFRPETIEVAAKEEIDLRDRVGEVFATDPLIKSWHIVEDANAVDFVDIDFIYTSRNAKAVDEMVDRLNAMQQLVLDTETKNAIVASEGKATVNHQGAANTPPSNGVATSEGENSAACTEASKETTFADDISSKIAVPAVENPASATVQATLAVNPTSDQPPTSVQAKNNENTKKDGVEEADASSRDQLFIARQFPVPVKNALKDNNDLASQITSELERSCRESGHLQALVSFKHGAVFIKGNSRESLDWCWLNLLRALKESVPECDEPSALQNGTMAQPTGGKVHSRPTAKTAEVPTASVEKEVENPPVANNAKKEEEPKVTAEVPEKGDNKPAVKATAPDASNAPQEVTTREEPLSDKGRSASTGGSSPFIDITSLPSPTWEVLDVAKEGGAKEGAGGEQKEPATATAGTDGKNADGIGKKEAVAAPVAGDVDVAKTQDQTTAPRQKDVQAVAAELIPQFANAGMPLHTAAQFPQAAEPTPQHTQAEGVHAYGLFNPIPSALMSPTLPPMMSPFGSFAHPGFGTLSPHPQMQATAPGGMPGPLGPQYTAQPSAFPGFNAQNQPPHMQTPAAGSIPGPLGPQSTAQQSAFPGFPAAQSQPPQPQASRPASFWPPQHAQMAPNPMMMMGMPGMGAPYSHMPPGWPYHQQHYQAPWGAAFPPQAYPQWNPWGGQQQPFYPHQQMPATSAPQGMGMGMDITGLAQGAPGMSAEQPEHPIGKGGQEPGKQIPAAEQPPKSVMERLKDDEARLMRMGQGRG